MSKFQGFLSLSAYIDLCLREVYKTKGKSLKKIIYEWDKIVSNELAAHTTPYKISNSKHQGQNQRVLHILVNNSTLSSELYYMSNMILEKISFYAGTGYISQLKFDLNPSSQIHPTEDMLLPIQELDIDTEGIEDPLLANSLKKLGQVVMSSKNI